MCVCMQVYFWLFLFQTQELYEKQFITVKEISETQETMSQLEQLKEHLKAKGSSLQRKESERLTLTEKLQASQEELKTIIKEGDELERIQEALQKETDQLKENTKEIVADVSYPLLMFFGYKSSVEVIMMMFTIKLD